METIINYRRNIVLRLCHLRQKTINEKMVEDKKISKSHVNKNVIKTVTINGSRRIS